MNHKHDLKKTHITLIEFDDVKFDKLVDDLRYFGEGNSKNRTLEFDFQYCLTCNLRTINGEPAVTQGILEDEFERFVNQAKLGNYKAAVHTTVQHSEFEVLQRIIKAAIAFGKLKQNL